MTERDKDGKKLSNYRLFTMENKFTVLSHVIVFTTINIVRYFLKVNN
ncbi:MAG: hypothetical protein L7F77_12740 [Candidatus Magnetominusculus sp. LBB02]|nr:hypothetical protein [Candidatus Magnetominusculus sp. LBB02]